MKSLRLNISGWRKTVQSGHTTETKQRQLLRITHESDLHLHTFQACPFAPETWVHARVHTRSAHHCPLFRTKIEVSPKPQLPVKHSENNTHIYRMESGSTFFGVWTYASLLDVNGRRSEEKHYTSGKLWKDSERYYWTRTG